MEGFFLVVLEHTVIITQLVTVFVNGVMFLHLMGIGLNEVMASRF